MKNPILNSATKIVLIIVTLAVTILTFMKIVDAKDFIVLVSMVFTYYFTKAQTVQEANTESGQSIESSLDTIQTLESLKEK